MRLAFGSSEIPSRRLLVGVWIGNALLLGVLLVGAQLAEGPLDDPDQARQRPGFLDEGELPIAAPELPGETLGHGPAVIFFERPDRLERLCDALIGKNINRRAQPVVVVSGEGGRCAVAAVVQDPSGDLVAAFGLREPSDDGPPVGYAVVDSRRWVRYRTLDPAAADNLDEVATIVKAVP